MLRYPMGVKPVLQDPRSTNIPPCTIYGPRPRGRRSDTGASPWKYPRTARAGSLQWTDTSIMTRPPTRCHRSVAGAILENGKTHEQPFMGVGRDNIGSRIISQPDETFLGGDNRFVPGVPGKGLGHLQRIDLLRTAVGVDTKRTAGRDQFAFSEGSLSPWAPC